MPPLYGYTEKQDTANDHTINFQGDSAEEYSYDKQIAW